MTKYYITKSNRVVTDVSMTGNGFVTYILDPDHHNMQLFSELERDMFLALIKRSPILAEKEKKYYKAHEADEPVVNLVSDETFKTIEALKKALQQGWKVKYD